ncbi:MAG: hypothetical protein KH321_10970, partial [Clostridium sp.]|nr:hypothetical protein [Clostridium sp.]
PFDKAGINQMVQEANDGIKVLCSKHGVPYVDYHSALCREDKKTMKNVLFFMVFCYLCGKNEYL